MIAVQNIVNRMNSLLDAEGSDRYLFDYDHKFAINGAIKWLTSLFDAAFAEKKFSEEQLRELTRTGVWTTSNRSRFAFDPDAKITDELWTILAIYPKITYTGSLASQTNPAISVHNPNAILLTHTEHAKRLTLEEWGEKDRNVFMSGNGRLNWADYADYAYLNFMEYDATLTDPQEIEISPAINNSQIGMSYLKVPDEVTLITDNVEFPAPLEDMIVQKALQLIAIKQGDDTGLLYKITESELDRLTKYFT